MQDFKNLDTWKKAHSLALSIYQTTQTFPRDEAYGLTSQLRRACVSIPANIAEGCGKQGGTELKHYLQIAQGSASELDYHILLAHDLNYIDDSEYAVLSDRISEVRRMLTSFIRKLSANS